MILTNPYLTGELSPPTPRSFRSDQWEKRGYHADLAPFSSDSEFGVTVGQMGWAGWHACTSGYLWGSAGNMGYLLSDRVSGPHLLPIDQSPRYELPPEITVPNLADRHVLLSKSGSRLDMIGLEHPSLNTTIIEIERGGRTYRMRYGTPTIRELDQFQIKPPKPTSEFFHYLLIFDQLGDQGFTALVHLQPKFLNLISRSEHGDPDKFYRFVKGYEPETPIMYDRTAGIGLVLEKAPGIPELSFESLKLFKCDDLPHDQRSEFRHIVYWMGHGTFSRGTDILDAYRHSEYFEAAARMAWEANQQSIRSEAYSDEIVECILKEFQANQTATPQTPSTSKNSIFNY